MYPTIAPPIYSRYGGIIEPGYPLELTSNEGIIYYTTDQSDPRSVGGGLTPGASVYTVSPIVIKGTTTVKARVKSGNTWSALAQATFYGNNNTNFDEIQGLTEVLVYPNPFNCETSFNYTLNKTEAVYISIHSIDGRLISILANENQTAGTYQLTWNAGKMEKGVYIYIITVGHNRTSGKLVIIK